MTDTQTLIMMGAFVAGTLVTRFLPFFLFPPHRKTPEYVLYLGRALPYAMMGFLVIFCLKGVSITAHPYGLPEGLAILSILGIHLLLNNVLVSIGGGTLIYMILVQQVFI